MVPSGQETHRVLCHPGERPMEACVGPTLPSQLCPPQTQSVLLGAAIPSAF